MTDELEATLLLVPVLYSIFVLDLKIVKWQEKGAHSDMTEGNRDIMKLFKVQDEGCRIDINPESRLISR